jgi:hypothetical protein
MIRHIVVCKLRQELATSELDDILSVLRDLPSQIDDVLSLECGLDELHSERSYDFGLVAMFADKGALARYQVHPAHVAIALRLRSASLHLVVVDHAM